MTANSASLSASRISTINRSTIITDKQTYHCQILGQHKIIRFPLEKNVLFFDPFEILCPKLKCNIYDKKKNILKLVDNSDLSKEGSLILVPSFRLFFKKEILK